MSKVRIYEVAKQLNLDPKAVVALFQAVGVTEVRNHMSSVEPEAVERVKRHLEKQKTHDVVEERIRRGAGVVVKRRAIAKPSDVAAPVSSPSVRDVAPAPPSRTDVSADGNGHGAAPVAPPSVPSGRLPVERASAREIPAPAPSVKEVVAEARKSSAALPVVEEPPPPPPPPVSVKEVAPPPPVSVKEVAPPPPPPPSVKEVAPPPPVVEAAPEPPKVQTPPPPPERAPEPARPKTGVEYWTGRPGVPMPTPASAQRTAIGGGAAGAMPRRVQYDPRAGAGGP
jgi:translation initiation factor IF-2